MIQYYKQTQLEAMASEKAAAEFQLEKEVKCLKEAQVSVFSCTMLLNLVVTYNLGFILLMFYNLSFAYKFTILLNR